MSRKPQSTRLQPEAESLETMVMMSLVAPAPSPSPVPTSTPLVISGTFEATGHEVRLKSSHGILFPASFEASGSGTLVGLGHAKIAIVVLQDSGHSWFTGLTLVTRQGELILADEAGLPAPGTGPVATEYGISDGQGPILNRINVNNPTGTVTVSETALSGGKVAMKIQLS